MMTDQLTSLLTPPRDEFNLLFARRRGLTFEEIYDDSKRVISKIATNFTDQTCQELHFENLVGEGMKKLSELIDKGKLEVMSDGKITTRGSWFAFLKTTVNNHVKGLVHRYRFTIKRTGQRPPDRGIVAKATMTKGSNILTDIELKPFLNGMGRKGKEFIFSEELLGQLREHYTGDTVVANCDGIPEDTSIMDLDFVSLTLDNNCTANGRVELTIGATKDYHKNVEVSLDDPDCHLQVGQDMSNRINDAEFGDLCADIRKYLTPFEDMIFTQLCTPNAAALVYATCDAYRGKTLDKVEISVTYPHMAQGLGIPLEVFLSSHKALQPKIKHLMELQLTSSGASQDAKYSAAVHALEQVFGLEAPLNVEPVVVKRLFTLAARDNLTKVTADVGKLMDLVGAKRPQQREGTLSCFGILYERNHKICSGCGAREACMLEATNLGLNEITIARSVLTSKANTRIPVVPVQGESMTTVLTSSVPDEGAFDGAMNERDEEILHYLNEHFKKTKHKADTYYKHKDKLPCGRLKFIFRVGHDDRGQLTLLFCMPSAALHPKLVKVKNGAYLPETATAGEAIALIDQHSKETFC